MNSKTNAQRLGLVYVHYAVARKRLPERYLIRPIRMVNTFGGFVPPRWLCVQR